jgi:hypothetical protein
MRIRRACRPSGFGGRLTDAAAFVVVRGVLGDLGVDDVGFFSTDIGSCGKKPSVADGVLKGAEGC